MKNSKTNKTKKLKNSTHSNKNKVCKSVKTTQESQEEKTLDLSPRFLEEGERVRTVSIELYASPEHWGKLLDKASHYAYILHDKDTKSDGTPKESHYHVLLHFPEGHTKSAMRKMTDLDSLDKDYNMLFQKLPNPHGAFKYLTHDTKKAREEKKFKYDESLVVTNDLLYWQDCVSDTTSPNQEFLDDLLNDHYSHYNLAVKYGRDYMKNYRSYMDFRNEVQWDTKRENVLKIRKELFQNLEQTENASDESTTPYELLTEYIVDLILLQYENVRKNSHSSLLLKKTSDEFMDKLGVDVLNSLSRRDR